MVGNHTAGTLGMGLDVHELVAPGGSCHCLTHVLEPAQPPLACRIASCISGRDNGNAKGKQQA